MSTLVKREPENKFTDRENAWVAGVMMYVFSFLLHPFDAQTLTLHLPASSAGAETTAAVMAWFMLAMTLYPDVQQKCQEEIDRVVGRDRMPNFGASLTTHSLTRSLTLADFLLLGVFEQMPYIRATVKEVLRWRPVDVRSL